MDIIYTATNDDLGIKSQVVTDDEVTFSVVLWDTEEDELFPTTVNFADEQKAIDYARDVARSGDALDAIMEERHA